MHTIRAAAAAGLIALALTGCAQLTNAWQGAQTLYAKVKLAYEGAPKTVYTLESGYAIIQSAAAAFKTSECPAVTSMGGKCATIVPKLRTYDKTARDALTTAENFVRANPTADASTVIRAAETIVEGVAQAETNLGITPAK